MVTVASYTLWSTDDKAEDAALRRLTGGFATKAEAIRKHCEAGNINKADYVAVAISGFRLSQELPVAERLAGLFLILRRHSCPSDRATLQSRLATIATLIGRWMAIQSNDRPRRQESR